MCKRWRTPTNLLTPCWRGVPSRTTGLDYNFDTRFTSFETYRVKSVGFYKIYLQSSFIPLRQTAPTSLLTRNNSSMNSSCTDVWIHGIDICSPQFICYWLTASRAVNNKLPRCFRVGSLPAITICNKWLHVTRNETHVTDNATQSLQFLKKDTGI